MINLQKTIKKGTAQAARYKTMLNKGIIINEFGEKQGWYSFRLGQGKYTIHWMGMQMNGYEEDGVRGWADRLGLQLRETE